MTPPSLDLPDYTRAHILFWRRTRRLTVFLSVLWACVTFLSLYFARSLANLQIFGWPISLYLAGQGLTLFYLVLIGVYTLSMRRLARLLEAERAATGISAEPTP